MSHAHSCIPQTAAAAVTISHVFLRLCLNNTRWLSLLSHANTLGLYAILWYGRARESDCYDYEISDWIYQRNHWLACILGFIFGFMIWPQSTCEHEHDKIQTRWTPGCDREREKNKEWDGRKWKSMNGLLVEIWIEHLLSHRLRWDEMHSCAQFKWSKNFHLTGFDGKPYTLDTERKCCVCVYAVKQQTLHCANIGFVCLWYVNVAHVSVATNADRIQFTA